MDPKLWGIMRELRALLGTYLTGTGRHRVQIAHFFRGQIGSRTPSGIGLGSGSRLRRMRPWSSPESSGSKSLGDHDRSLRSGEDLY